jgi:hypothetical protein
MREGAHMSSSFDRIAASAPLNATAARVTSKGEHYESLKRITQLHWDAPPKMREVTATDLEQTSFTDLRGRQFGRLTVLGILAREKTGSTKPNVWVVKCVCGDYESRTGKAIRNPANSDDCCQKCRQVAYLRRRETRKALGLVKPDTVEGFLEGRL